MHANPPRPNATARVRPRGLPTRHLVLFIKLPRIGRIKTRLATDIGPVPAWTFCRGVTASLFHRLAARGRWCCWLALERFGQRGRDGLANAGWTRLLQDRGDLGRRMSGVLNQLPPGPVVIVGNDAPDVAPTHIARAFAALRSCDAVFGPAVDGGYWLIGLRRRYRHTELFNDVRWSTRHALSDTLANLPRQKVVFLDLLEDVDHGPAYHRWVHRHRADGSPRLNA